MTFETPTFWEAAFRAQDMQKHPDTHHPPCAGCGMPLAPDPGKDDLICNYCGLRHRFLPPPDPSGKAEFHIGDNVAVEWKENWWFAHVVDEFEDDDKWLVHFIGWAPAFDAEVDRSRIRAINYFPGDTIIRPPAAPTTAKPTAPMTRSESIGTIVTMILLTILGFTIMFLFPQTLNVPGTAIQSAPSWGVTGPVSDEQITLATPIRVGQQLQVNRGDNWYVGTAIRVDRTNGNVTVRYTRAGKEYEETVPRQRLRQVE
ncbi:MAG: hypothetical protein JXX14_17525 [Deltaproteobacteria bacterium]|nr:hypothetical protein [Deltaproteobacteria bacterium]